VAEMAKIITLMKMARKEILRLRSLPYIEMNLTDHCNLNCEWCSHYSPMAPKKFADFGQFQRDFTRLSELCTFIGEIRLLGGEPLLNPNINKFLKFARESFPDPIYTRIRVVTNGLLLSKMPQSFWDTMKSSSIALDVTVYPGMPFEIPDIERLIRSHGIKSKISQTHTFNEIPIKISNKDENFKICREHFFCPILRNGRIYLCPQAAMYHLCSKDLQAEQLASSIDIYTSTHREIVEFMNKPAPFCSYCNWENYRTHPWKRTRMATTQGNV
jgi:organic radical activating enzyme